MKTARVKPQYRCNSQQYNPPRARPLTLKKLDAYGFNSSSLELIRSFFDSRLNRVKINGHTSEWRIMERGCPQGSSFGSLLWNMFQNDMAFHIPDSNLTLYADDHQLYVTGKTYEEVESTLETQQPTSTVMV